MKNILNKKPTLIESGYLDHVYWTEGLKSDKELKKVINWLEEFSKDQYVAIDYETNCFRPFEKDSRLITLAIANETKSCAFPIEYKNAWSSEQLTSLKDALTKFFNSPVKKICHNVKFEMEWTAERFGMNLLYPKTWEDTQAQAYVLDERRGMLNLDSLIRIYFGFWLKELSNLDRSRMESYPLEKILPYNGLDSKWTLQLFHQQKELVKQESKLYKMYKMLIDTAASLTATQIRGVVLDYNNHAELEKQFTDELLEIENTIQKLPEVKQFKDRFGLTFNPGSPDHVLRCLKNIMGLDHELQKDTGKYSTDESVLSSLTDVELAQKILDYRGISKKISTYIEPYPQYVLADGKIHTNFNPYETSTGRLSSNSPNLQNVPSKTGKELRRIIGVPKDHWMVCSDYGQIEARIIGVASQDEEFCKALWEDYDVHMEWAKKIAEEYPKVVGGTSKLNDKAAMKKFRAKVKNLWVFPAFYGASPNSISKGIGVPIDIVQDIFREFWRTFRGVKRWQKWILNRYEKLGYVETLTGRRRHAPMSMNAVLNASIQGFASDICVDAMCRLDRLGIQTVMIIHDDVTSYVHDDDLETAIPMIAEEMCKVPYPFINVPIAVEMTAGKNWFDQEEIGTFKSTEFHHVPSELQDFTKLYDFT
jgi:DNA polymerase-1